MPPVFQSNFSIRTILSNSSCDMENDNEVCCILSAPTTPPNPPTPSDSNSSDYVNSEDSATAPPKTAVAPEAEVDVDVDVEIEVDVEIDVGTDVEVVADANKEAGAEPEPDMGPKPGFTYSSLIVMAIRSSAEQRLTLASICEWISHHFAYFQKSKTFWQNSIRHNLSMHSCFVRVPRALDDPGRGHYWTLGPSADELIVGETTGRLRRNTTLSRSFSPMRSKANLHFAGGFMHPYHLNMTVVNPMTFAHHYTPNAVYFPTPEEIRLVQQSMLQAQREQQAAWDAFHRQQQQQRELQQMQHQHQYQQLQQMQHQLPLPLPLPLPPHPQPHQLPLLPAPPPVQHHFQTPPFLLPGGMMPGGLPM